MANEEMQRQATRRIRRGGRCSGAGGGFGLGAHEGEEDDVADAARAGEEHGEAVYSHPLSCGRGQSISEGADVVFVDFGHGLGVFVVDLGEEAVALVVGVVELGEGVADFEAADVELEALDPVGFVGLDLGEGRDGQGEVVDDRGLDEVGFGEEFRRGDAMDFA